jgi:hypothetical protein
MLYHEQWTIISTFTTIVIEGFLAVCVATVKEILRPAHWPARVSGVQWPQHVALLSPVSNAEVNNTWIVASTPPGFFMSQWDGSGKTVLIFIFLPALLEEVICIRLGIVLSLIYRTQWNRKELWQSACRSRMDSQSSRMQVSSDNCIVHPSKFRDNRFAGVLLLNSTEILLNVKQVW